MTRYVPHDQRLGSSPLDAFDRALALMSERHEQHKADIQRTSERLDRAARLLGKVGAV